MKFQPGVGLRSETRETNGKDGRARTKKCSHDASQPSGPQGAPLGFSTTPPPPRPEPKDGSRMVVESNTHNSERVVQPPMGTAGERDNTTQSVIKIKKPPDLRGDHMEAEMAHGDGNGHFIGWQHNI